MHTLSTGLKRDAKGNEHKGSLNTGWFGKVKKGVNKTTKSTVGTDENIFCCVYFGVSMCDASIAAHVDGKSECHLNAATKRALSKTIALGC